MSKLAKFYNKIFDYSLKKGTHIKFVDMLRYQHVSPSNSIPIMTKHIYNEIPIRLAKRVTDLNSLPFGLSQNHSINKIREWYLLSFEELTQVKEPISSSDIIDFKDAIHTIYNRHSTTLSTISKGLYELQVENKLNDIEAPVIQAFLNKFHKNRTEIRILLEHYMSFFEKTVQDGKYHGIIHLDSNVKTILHNTINNIQLLCDANGIDLHLNDIIKVNAPRQIILPTIDHYLYYILFEILKNSVEAVRFRRNPFIEVTMKEIDEDWILIKIQDNGTGIQEKDLDKIWYYSYTTHPINNADILEQTDFSNKSPLSGYGYGLPISEIYVNFFNSSSHNIKIFSNNTDRTSVYIYLKNIRLTPL
jgi:pyruvate dehydrogenase kinase 2/3/4